MNKERWNKLVRNLMEDEIDSCFDGYFQVWRDKYGIIHYVMTTFDRKKALYVERIREDQIIDAILHTDKSRYDHGEIQSKEPREEIERLASEINEEEKKAYEQETGEKWVYHAYQYDGAGRTRYYENIVNDPESRLIADDQGIYIHTEEGEKLLGCNRNEHAFLYALEGPVMWPVSFLFMRLEQADREGLPILSGIKTVIGRACPGIVLITSPFRYTGLAYPDASEEIKQFKHGRWEADALDIVTGSHGKVGKIVSQLAIEKGLDVAPDQDDPDHVDIRYSTFNFPKFLTPPHEF